MSELEDKSKYNMQTAVQRDKAIENIEYQGRDIWAIVKTSNICITKIVKRKWEREQSKINFCRDNS